MTDEELKKFYQQHFDKLPWYGKLGTAAADVARTFTDDLTFGLADRGMSMMTGRNEPAITKAIRARMGHADLPGAFGAGMLTPSAVPSMVGRVGGGPATRHAVGLLGGAGEGALQGAAYAAGHGEDMKQGATTGAIAAPLAHGLTAGLNKATNTISNKIKGVSDKLPPPHIGNVKGYEAEFTPPPGYTDDFTKSREGHMTFSKDKNDWVSRPGTENYPRYWEYPDTHEMTPKAMIESAAQAAHGAGGKPHHYMLEFQSLKDDIDANAVRDFSPEEYKVLEKALSPTHGDFLPHMLADAAERPLAGMKLSAGIPPEIPMATPIMKAADWAVGKNMMEPIEAARRYAIDLPEIPSVLSPILQGRLSKGMRRGIISSIDNEENF